jgi:putative restriction endonuclease
MQKLLTGQNTRSYCVESPKPIEFGLAGADWESVGWRVDVQFEELRNRLRPKDHIEEIRHALPKKYSPLRSSGDGLQNIYLVEISRALAEVLFRLIGREANQVADVASEMNRVEPLTASAELSTEEWENRVECSIRENPTLSDTQRIALIRARRGQGLFRWKVQSIERACRVTKVDRLDHLVASHVKPWRDGSNEERLNGENGLLLTPTIDHLFDRGFISFEDNGDLIVSPVADHLSLRRMGIPIDTRFNVGSFSEGQRRFLDYHRQNVLLMSNVKRR